MSRDSGAHGVQVVAGSNPACPTNHNPDPTDNLGQSANLFASRETGSPQSCLR